MKSFLSRIKESHLYLMLLLVTMVATGITYWPVPYGELNIRDFFITWIITTGAVTFLFTAIRSLSIVKTVGYAALGLLAAVIIKILIDYIADPSTHGLFYYELLIGLSTGIGGGIIGLLAGRILRTVVFND